MRDSSTLVEFGCVSLNRNAGLWRLLQDCTPIPRTIHYTIILHIETTPSSHPPSPCFLLTTVTNISTPGHNDSDISPPILPFQTSDAQFQSRTISLCPLKQNPIDDHRAKLANHSSCFHGLTHFIKKGSAPPVEAAWVVIYIVL